MVTFTVRKLDHKGQEVWRYPAESWEAMPEGVRLIAYFNRPDMTTGYTTFKRGDRFVEYFYPARWYNVHAVYDRDDGMLKGWYCNVCRPAQVDALGVAYEDLALDVWVNADGGARVLDEEAYMALGLDSAETAHVEHALATLLHLAQTDQLPR